MRRAPKVTTIDFETLPIQQRPEYPPEPVGVSIQRYCDKKPRYYAWGHRTGDNNCSKAQAKRALAEAWDDRKSGVGLLFQNAQFDVDVATTHMGMKMPEWDQIEDTMFLLFLWDPHAPDLQLKPSAERILGEAPEERDAMIAWLWDNRKRLAAETDAARWLDAKGKAFLNSKTKIGALVAYAPGSVAGPYANGDVSRTRGLFNHLWPRIAERGMVEAYDRERQIMPILLENERVGMRVDVPLLREDVRRYTQSLQACEGWMRRKLAGLGGTTAKTISFDNDEEVAAILSQTGMVRDEDWTLTATGNRSVSKKNLRPDMYQDAQFASAFGYRNRLVTCLRMFMEPWIGQAERRGDSYISTNWNQVRQPGGGTRTGRPSTSNPNFLNLSKRWDDKDDGYEHPRFIRALPELPLVRRYILPDDRSVFLHRDFDGQELRVAAHFEDGPLLAAYQDDPHLDIHDHIRILLEQIAGLFYHRSQVKITNFRRIYGGGAPATAGALNISMETAKELLRAHAKALPGLTELSKRITALARAGEPIVTWGGREYYPEPPKYDKRFGREMTYEYKLLNYLVQGSAADLTKEAIIRFHNHPKRRSRFLVTVYDEINVSSPAKAVTEQMAILRECMEGLELDVPLLSTGKTGPRWGELTKYKEKPYASH